MVLFRNFFLIAAIFTVHIPGTHNVIADSLLWFRMQRFWSCPTGLTQVTQMQSVLPSDSGSNVPEAQPPDPRPCLTVWSWATAVLLPLLPNQSMLSSSRNWHPRLEDPNPWSLEQLATALAVSHQPSDQQDQQHRGSPSRSSTIIKWATARPKGFVAALS